MRVSPIILTMARTAALNRDTNETKIQVNINFLFILIKIALSLDGGDLQNLGKDGAATNSVDSEHATQKTASQIIEVNTGIGFLDHVLQHPVMY